MPKGRCGDWYVNESGAAVDELPGRDTFVPDPGRVVADPFLTEVPAGKLARGVEGAT